MFFSSATILGEKSLPDKNQLNDCAGELFETTAGTFVG